MQWVTNTAELVAGLLAAIKAGHHPRPVDEVLNSINDRLSDILTELSKDVPHDQNEE
jgi:hypothetical protein